MVHRSRGRRRTIGHWNDLEGFAAYRAVYEAVMATVPEPSHRLDVATEYGIARVYEWSAEGVGTDTMAPALLLPGVRSGAPMWAENMKYWIGRRPVYAVDAIGDAGLSIQSVPFDGFDDQAAWVEQMLTGLRADHVHVVGHSFGGAIAATHALLHPDRVASVTLLEPVMVLRGLPASMYVWSALLLMPGPQAWKDVGLARIGGVTVEEVRERTPMSVMIDEGAKSFGGVSLRPRTLTDDEWRSLPMPVRVDLADTSSLAGGGRAAERARTLGLGPVTVWPRTTHSLPFQVAEEIGPELERYWATHDPS